MLLCNSRSDDDSFSVITAGDSEDAFILGSNEDSDGDMEDVTSCKNDNGEKYQYLNYILQRMVVIWIT